MREGFLQIRPGQCSLILLCRSQYCGGLAGCGRACSLRRLERLAGRRAAGRLLIARQTRWIIRLDCRDSQPAIWGSSGGLQPPSSSQYHQDKGYKLHSQTEKRIQRLNKQNQLFGIPRKLFKTQDSLWKFLEAYLMESHGTLLLLIVTQ